MAATQQESKTTLRLAVASRNTQGDVAGLFGAAINALVCETRAAVREELEASNAGRASALPPLPRRYSQSELCEIYGVSRAVVAAWVKGGLPKIPCGAQSPRYDLAEVDAWLRSQEPAK